MIDFDKMTVAEHEQYREMKRKAEAFDKISYYLRNEYVSSNNIITAYGRVIEIVRKNERTD